MLKKSVFIPVLGFHDPASRSNPVLKTMLKIAEVWEALQGFKFQQLHNFTSFRDLVG